MTILEVVGIIFIVGLCLLLASIVNEVRWWIVYAPDIEAAIITTLSKVEKMKARSLRKSLETQRFRVGLSRFYVVMANLVDDGCVEMWDEPHEEYIDPKVYWYKLISGGRKKKVRSPLKLGLQSLLPHPVM